MNDHAPPIQPLGLGPSLLYFGLPAIVFVIGFWVLMPWFITMGMLPYYAYLLGLSIPLATLLVLSLVWLRREGREITWATMQWRLRLWRMDRRAWLWSLGAVLVGSVLGYGLVSQLSGLLIQRGIMPIPASIPDFMDPTSAPDWMAAIDAAVGGLRGNWLLLVALTITLTLNILGEELWWRGVVLPRQELAFGKGTWVIHGVLWGFFHLFKWWDVLNLLPITLALSFVCSRLRNTTPGIVIHSVTNGVALVALFAGVVGLIG